MEKLWDFFMRRKPLCLTFLLIFAVSVVLSNRFLAERFALLLEPANSSISAPIETPDDLSVGPSESPAEPPAAPVETPIDITADTPTDVSTDASVEDPADALTELPIIASDEISPTPVASENYFIQVASPCEVIAMLTTIEVPRTGGESTASGSAINALSGVANASDGLGAGANLFGDTASASDPVGAAISASTIAQLEPAHGGFWLNLLVTLASLLALLGLFSLAAHFLR